MTLSPTCPGLRTRQGAPQCVSPDQSHTHHSSRPLKIVAMFGIPPMLLTVLTDRSDLCIAGVFGAGKHEQLRSWSWRCHLCSRNSKIILTKENVAARALSDHIIALAPPNLQAFGRLLGRMEERKGEAHSNQIQ